MKLTPERKALFIAELTKHGCIIRAARAASPHSEHGCKKSFREERDRDPAFAEAWDLAMDTARAGIHAEIRRRAIEGVDRPIYQGGELVGTEKVYSDRLLEILARAHLPEYREKIELDQTLKLDGPSLAEAIRIAATEIATGARMLAREEEQRLLEGPADGAV